MVKTSAYRPSEATPFSAHSTSTCGLPNLSHHEALSIAPVLTKCRTNPCAHFYRRALGSPPTLASMGNVTDQGGSV
eukprot:3946341-Prymnesium_polylepis.1